jgi:uncharacterized protein YkwD
MAMGIPPLAVHPELQKAARGHSEEMRDKGYFSHLSPTQNAARPERRMAGEGYWAFRVGENIAAGRFTPESVLEGWKRSPGHHRNLLRGEYREAGLGIAGPKEGSIGPEVQTWWTQNFGSGDMNPASPTKGNP